MSIMRKVLDSKFMDIVEVIGDTTVEIIKGMAEVTCEVATELFSHPLSESSNCSSSSKNNNTYEYWKNLDYSAQEYYFKSNEYLKDYIKNDYYSGDRELTAKHVQEISDKLGRDFTNINNRY